MTVFSEGGITVSVLGISLTNVATTEIGSPLPSYETPPVSEVVLAVSFTQLDDLGSLEILDFYRERFVGNGFTSVEEKMRYDMPVEQFGTSQVPPFRFEIADAPPRSRYWFGHEQPDQLVQIQSDWFARNWRRTPHGYTYPHYLTLREPFKDDLLALTEFVSARNLGSLEAIQCEITYVNEISSDEIWNKHGQMGRVVKVWNDLPTEQMPYEPEQVQWSASYLIGADGPVMEGAQPLMRLHVTCQPALKDGLPIYVATLTSRGAPATPDLDGVLALLDLGHEWIVRTFEALTTDAMQHKTWKKEES